MSEMVERVAEALMRVPQDEKISDYYAFARAAIAAMREPTDEMTTAAWAQIGDGFSLREWHVMIDAALK